MSEHYEDLALAEYKSVCTYNCSFGIKILLTISQFLSTMNL